MTGESDRDQRRRDWITALQLGGLCIAGLLVYPVVGFVFDALTESRPVLGFLLAVALLVAALATIVWFVVRRSRRRRTS